MEKEIILKIDSKVFDYLSEEIKRKRQNGVTKSVSDIFLIRLIDALNKGNQMEVFKFKDKK